MTYEVLKELNMKIAMLGICIFIIACLCCDSYEYQPSKSSVYVAAQEFVKERLRAPSTAKFPEGSYEYVEELGQIHVLRQHEKSGHSCFRYRVKSYVDAQNAFGAQIRTHFVCEITYLGDKKWQLDSIEFLN